MDGEKKISIIIAIIRELIFLLSKMNLDMYLVATQVLVGIHQVLGRKMTKHFFTLSTIKLNSM
jgi:hypothetical protein